MPDLRNTRIEQRLPPDGNGWYVVEGGEDTPVPFTTISGPHEEEAAAQQVMETQLYSSIAPAYREALSSPGTLADIHSRLAGQTKGVDEVRETLERLVRKHTVSVDEDEVYTL